MSDRTVPRAHVCVTVSTAQTACLHLGNAVGEQETEWHRGWKNEFPVERQEVLRRAPAVKSMKTANGGSVD